MTRKQTDFAAKTKRRAALLLGLAACALLTACNYPVRNVRADRLNSMAGVTLVADSDTLIIVSASGGGTRATALVSG